MLVEGEPLPPAAAETAAVAEDARKMAPHYCQPLPLGEAARQLLRDTQTPLEYFDPLVANGLLVDALRFLAFWLPKPVAVGWGVSCVEGVFGDSLPKQHQQALASAAKWAAEPEEARGGRPKRRPKRRTTMARPVFWRRRPFGAAAAWSRPKWPSSRPPKPHRASHPGRPVDGRARHGNPLKAPERYQAFLQSGRKLAEENEKKEGDTNFH